MHGWPVSYRPAGCDWGRGCVLGGAWPGSRSRPGAQAEARARPRSASRARGERFSVPGVGSDKGQRGLAAWQGGFPVPLGTGAQWWGGRRHYPALLFPGGSTGETVQAWVSLGGARRCFHLHPQDGCRDQQGSGRGLTPSVPLMHHTDPVPGWKRLRADLGKIKAFTGPNL